MYTRAIPYAVAAFLTGILKQIGGFQEIMGFKGYFNVALTGGIILNILVVLVFAEIYLTMDKVGEGRHFGGDIDNYTDALYFSTISSVSIGYGDILPKTKSAKMVVITHAMLQFFVLVPLLLESFKPGN